MEGGREGFGGNKEDSELKGGREGVSTEEERKLEGDKGGVGGRKKELGFGKRSWREEGKELEIGRCRKK